MATELTGRATEKSTYIITASFTDEDSNAVTPNSLTWTLSDKNGTVINSREGIDFEVDDGTSTPGVLSATVNIILNGNDLQIINNRDIETRRIVLESTYDSSLGNDLPLRGAAEFEVVNLVAII